MSEDTASTAAAATTATAAGSDAASTATTTATAAATTAAAAAPAPAAAAAKPAAGSVLTDGDAAAVDAAKTVKGDWPDDWRQRAATAKDGKVDEKRLARLGRYASPLAAMDALISAQDRIAKGDLAKVLGPTPTPEEVAEYRLANGIPEKPDGYKVELPNGRVIGEVDKPLVGKFLEAMHKTNATPALVNSALTAYYELQDDQIRQREDADLDAKVAVEDSLRGEYGQEYRPNLNAVRGLLAQFPDGAGEKLASARFADGSLIFNDASMVKAFVHLAREMNPAATIVPGSSGNAQTSITDEIGKYRGMMADGSWDKATPAMKARYEQLLEAGERLKQRAA